MGSEESCVEILAKLERCLMKNKILTNSFAGRRRKGQRIRVETEHKKGPEEERGETNGKGVKEGTGREPELKRCGRRR